MTESHELLTTVSYKDSEYDVYITGEFSYGWENYGEDADGNRGEKRGYCDLEVGMEIGLQPNIDVTDIVTQEFTNRCADALTESFNESLEGRQA